MNNLKLTVPCHKPIIPPLWSHLIERWHQLDDTSFTFCEAIYAWSYLKEYKPPNYIFLVLENASNFADLDYASSSVASPAKFVYTLPNVSAAVIFQMLNIHGTVFCLSKGSDSLKFALQEAEIFSKSGKTVWVFYNSTTSSQVETRVVEFFNCNKFLTAT